MMPWTTDTDPGRQGVAPRLEAGRPLLAFTDLDGTLLDHQSYRADAALPALRTLEARGVPIVMATSKTFDEVLRYQRLLSQPQPFVVENGGAICLPDGFVAYAPADERRDGYLIQRFPPGQAAIISAVESIRRDVGASFDSFHEGGAAWVAAVTGLDPIAAAAACRRSNSLPLLWRDSAAKLAQFGHALARAGLRLEHGGRFLHVQGAVDKSLALQRLRALFGARGLDNPQVVAFGDGPNDRAMLETADIAVVVRRPDGGHLQLGRRRGVILTNAVGPAGWAEAVGKLLGRGGAADV